MKTYFQTIKYIQETLLFISVVILMTLPLVIVFQPDIITTDVTTNLYLVAHIFLFFVMSVRPLADIFMETKWLRPLVILRKGTGVISASIIVSFILAKLMMDPATYLGSIVTLKYWSFVNYAILAHLADISAVILLITSNNLSKRILGDWWKSIQQLSYVYFYGSVLYVYLSYKNIYLLFALIIISLITYYAFLLKKRRIQSQVVSSEPLPIVTPMVSAPETRRIIKSI